MYLVAAGGDPRALHIQQVLAATRSLPNSVVSHASALVCHGLPLPGRPGTPPSPHLTIPTSRWRTGPTARVHISPLGVEDVMTLDGLPITTVARTAVDVARRSSIFDAQMVVDAAARLLMGTPGTPSLAAPDLRARVHDEVEREAAAHKLRDVVSRQVGWPGIRRARQAVDWAEPASESPAESWSRVRFILWNLPTPLCGAPVTVADGTTYWADFLWPEHGVIGECDGASKYVDPDVLLQEKRRQIALERAGYTVIRWLPAEVLTGGSDLRRHLHDALG